MTLWPRLALMLTLALSACTLPEQAPPQSSPDGPMTLDNNDIVLASALQPFNGCDELLDYFKREAREIVGPYGLPGTPGVTRLSTRATDAATAPLSGGAAAVGQAAGDSEAAAAPVEGVDYSGTNVQEAGVDEPDIVKTDGRLVVAAVNQSLQILDLGQPDQVAGTLDLEGWSHELLLDGQRVLVMTQADAMAPFVSEGMSRPSLSGPSHHSVSVLTLVDISDPTAPRVESQLTLDGTYRSARMTDGVARVVLSSQPTGLPFTSPESGGLRAHRKATRDNRRVIEESEIQDWLPYFVLERQGGEESEGTAVDCGAVARPAEFSGLGMVSVLSINLGGTLAPQSATAVVASGETVYASPDNLFVTTNRWMDPAAEDFSAPSAEDYTTEIHAFDISSPAAAEYVASGSVRGHLLNQFSMSEHDGHLRVATTERTPWEPQGGPDAAESFVTVLRVGDDALEAVGQVGELGPGERIYAVRFLGDVGYVVTFRETDPLYTIDLSDPTAPRTTGELKIRGYSAYLHPMGDGLLLGVGQDATMRGQTLGTQVSLFDVSDPAAPERVAKTTLRNSSSEAEWDHRAFLYWAPENLAVIPVASYDATGPRGAHRLWSGVRGFTVRPGGIDDVGRLRHPAGPAGGPTAQIRRSLVVDGDLLTFSPAGVMISTLDTFEGRSFTPFDG